MGHNSIEHWNREAPIGDVAYLARSAHRIPALVALTERPRRRSELCELTGVSDSTIRRTLDEFEDIEEDRFLSSHPETTPIQHDEFAKKLELRNAEFWRRLLDEITIIVDHQ